MIRQDFLESLQTRAAHTDLLERQLRVMEDLQTGLYGLDPQMKDWMPTGSDGGSLPVEIASMDLNKLRTESQRACIQNPWGKNIIRTLIKFIIGGGSIIDFEEKDEQKLEKINKWWNKCRKSVKWVRFQREYVRRCFRDGETIVRRFDGEEFLELRYVEPCNIPDDHIVLKKDDAQTIDYFKIGEERVDAAEIHFVKADVDGNVKRGRPILEPILPYLTKYDKWLAARMVLNIVRASVTIVQEIQGGTADLLRISGKQTATRQSPENSRTKMIRPGTIIRGTPGVQYKMLSPNLDARDAAEDGRTILLAVAAAAGFPDVFVTADYCHSMDTEVLTERGWLFFKDLRKDDKIGTMNPTSGELEYQQPSRLHTFRHQGEMYKFEGRRFNFCITPQHELFAAPYHAGRKRSESVRLHDRPLSEFKKVKVSELEHNLSVVPASVEWRGEDEPLFTFPDGTTIEMDLWLEFLGYVITDGCVTESTNGSVQITQKTPGKIPVIENCLQQLPWKYTTTVSNGAKVFRIWNNELREFIAHIIGTPDGAYSHQKHLPSFVWNLSPKYLQYLMDALILGDGGYSPRPNDSWSVYRTTSQQLADEVQRVAIMLGKATTLSSEQKDDYNPCYLVHMSDGHAQLLEAKKIKKIEWDGDVWCATVSNGLMITRLNGKPFISGNSGANFASTVVSQNPAIREFEDWQSYFSESLSEIVMWFLEDGVAKGQIPKEANLDFTISFPPLLRRDIAQEISAYISLNERNIMSAHSVALKAGLDPDEEKKMLEEEGGPYVPVKPQMAGEPPPKRVEDRNPRQKQVTGSEEIVPEAKKQKKTLKLTVKRQKEHANATSGTYSLECETLSPQPISLGTTEPQESTAL